MIVSIVNLSLTSQILLREFDFDTAKAISYARRTAQQWMTQNKQMAGEYRECVIELQKFQENQDMATSRDLPAMAPDAMIEHLKELGLAQTERSKVMETYRDAGQAEALEQAAGYLKSTAARLAGAKKMASHLVGITI